MGIWGRGGWEAVQPGHPKKLFEFRSTCILIWRRFGGRCRGRTDLRASAPKAVAKPKATQKKAPRSRRIPERRPRQPTPTHSLYRDELLMDLRTEAPSQPADVEPGRRDNKECAHREMRVPNPAEGLPERMHPTNTVTQHTPFVSPTSHIRPKT
jgi:hypothetical protein